MITRDDIQGHWQRRWIKAAGFEDHTTRVHWMQAGYDYADVRIPLTRPDLNGATCLAELSAESLSRLAAAEGFAGRVTLEGETCTWHRQINWHGTPEAPDMGKISFDDEGCMIEAGVLADYTELWEPRAKAAPRAFRFSNGHYCGVLVVTGQDAVLGIGQPAKPASAPLVEALSNGRVPTGVARLFDGLHAMCRIEDGRAYAVLATNPFVEGKIVAHIGQAALTWHHVGFDGGRSKVELPVETIPALFRNSLSKASASSCNIVDDARSVAAQIRF